MKLWGGRFTKEASEILEEFNSSIAFDKRMYEEDIAGSIAHSHMLAKQDIITFDEQKKIEDGLLKIKNDMENDNFVFSIKDEDIHMAIETQLIKDIGETGGKLHTARSRNDQVAVDIRMYLKKESSNIRTLLSDLLESLIDISEKNKEAIMPGYTHMQRAQPILFSHHIMAYYQMFKRDLGRLDDSYKRLDFMPLGASALAGTTYNIDRELVAKKLGFNEVTRNSLDTVSDRDFIIELNFIISMISMHMSRLSEEIILWSTSEFSFVTLDDSYSTGSSIMPQKKNPDIAELLRGKTGRIYGNLMGILTVMKGLPLAYNKDTQEDKEGVFDSIDTIKNSLVIFKEMLTTMKINEKNMYKDIENGFINATDVADYLAKKKLPFRDAHRIVGEIVVYCETNKKSISQLSLDEFKKFNNLFEEDINETISIKNCVNNRKSYGGTSPESLEVQLTEAKSFLGKCKS